MMRERDEEKARSDPFASCLDSESGLWRAHAAPGFLLTMTPALGPIRDSTGSWGERG